MKMLFHPQNQIKFQKGQNGIMEGDIQISNPNQQIFGFKIKCTNPDLFNVEPLKGIITTKASILIKFKTLDPINLDMAKQIALNHKFLIQYVAISTQNSVPNFKSSQCQRKKMYINMDSAHGSRLIKDNQLMSMHSALSNKHSYLSMKNDEHNNKNLISSSISLNIKNMPIQQQQQRYQKLKNEIHDLNTQRSQIIYKLSQNATKGSSNGLLPKIILLIIFLVFGALTGNFFARKYNERNQQIKKRRQQEQSRGWFDFLYLEEE